MWFWTLSSFVFGLVKPQTIQCIKCSVCSKSIFFFPAERKDLCQQIISFAYISFFVLDLDWEKKYIFSLIMLTNSEVKPVVPMKAWNLKAWPFKAAKVEIKKTKKWAVNKYSFNTFLGFIFTLHLTFSVKDWSTKQNSRGNRNQDSNGEKVTVQWFSSNCLEIQQQLKAGQITGEDNERWLKSPKCAERKRGTSWLLFCFSGIEQCLQKNFFRRMCLNFVAYWDMRKVSAKGKVESCWSRMLFFTQCQISGHTVALLSILEQCSITPVI